MRLISEFLESYEKQQKVITKNVFYLSQYAQNLTIEDCWNMSSSERETMLEVIKEIKQAEEDAMKKANNKF